MRVNDKHISVDAPIMEGADSNLLDVLPNMESPMADNELVMESLREEVASALNVLNKHERNTIGCFYGISQREMTLEEIGDKLGLTRKRVRQIKEKALCRLRQNMESKQLKAYLGRWA